MPSEPASQVVFTNKARCRDCYRCVRVCPVKAIRMHAGQAYVVEERCLACGTCVRECPQQAKSFRNDVDRAIRLMQSPGRKAASIAPSFAAVFPEWQRRRLPSALRRLGFSYVGETAIGAYHVATETARLVARRPGRRHISTACPAIVRYVERYRPAQVPDLVPVVSPMIAHARHIRQKLGAEAKVVFIGPCVAKKAEAERPELSGAVDCVLTFTELAEWLEREAVDLSACEESDFDEMPQGAARLFPLEGGSVRTAGWTADLLDRDCIAASGFEEVAAALDSEPSAAAPHVIEPLFCPQGCINGPAMPDSPGCFRRRSDVLQYATPVPDAHSRAAPLPSQPQNWLDLAATFSPGAGSEPAVAEDEIRRVLERTGKANLEDQLNCGACGYRTCREKAIAVLQGLAEPEMCIPYMKRLAEQRTDRIIETSPNGIVILDGELNILHMNPAFRRFFLSSDAVCGQPISYLMDPGPFERLVAGEELIEMVVEHDRYNLVCHQILYPLKEERQFVGIFVNITTSQASQQQLDRLRSETVLQARELLENQLQMAETIARCLGENAARSEDLLDKLVRMAEQKETEPGEARRRVKQSWLRDTYTSR